MPTAKLTIEEAGQFLRKAEDVLILAHVDPDGDTLGSCHALFWALKKLGKRAKVSCADSIAPRYGYMQEDKSLCTSEEDFEPKTVVASDVADMGLLGTNGTIYGDRVDLCIDHHPSNREYAKRLLLDSKAASTCEIMLNVILAMGVEPDSKIADCLYTGIATDTGCFRYANTTVNTHRAAARLMEAGADMPRINKLMFETFSKGRMALEAEAVGTLDYFFDGRCAMMTVSRDSIEENKVIEDELEGLSAIPRQIEGTEVGITLREKPSRREYKISMRTTERINASDVCQKLGGGGHCRAAGCVIAGTESEVKKRLVEALCADFSTDS